MGAIILQQTHQLIGNISPLCIYGSRYLEWRKPKALMKGSSSRAPPPPSQAHVAEIQVAGGRAQGVRLKDGTEIRATEVQLGKGRFFSKNYSHIISRFLLIAHRNR